ncbi:hypothetical protein R1flu_004559 [Riccia fluitans]|uniref:Uncharacterized protein n=1 Tax=Riccia fluitans TaxID=41844 RepID=A0ABD1YQP2_9MARC
MNIVTQPAKKAAIGGDIDTKPAYGNPTYDAEGLRDFSEESVHLIDTEAAGDSATWAEVGNNGAIFQQQWLQASCGIMWTRELFYGQNESVFNRHQRPRYPTGAPGFESPSYPDVANPGNGSVDIYYSQIYSEIYFTFSPIALKWKPRAASSH